MKKAIYNIAVAASVAAILWGVLSWADIVAHNMDESPKYSKYNAIVLMFNHDK